MEGISRPDDSLLLYTIFIINAFLTFSDIQSWYEVPSIAHFCSLFRAAFSLVDFDIEVLISQNFGLILSSVIT